MDSGFRRSDGSTTRARGHIHRHTGSPRPSYRLPQPSFRIPSTAIPPPPAVIPAKAGIYARLPHRRLPQPSYRIPNRHSGESRNLCLPAPSPPPPTAIPSPPTVVPAQAGIQAVKNPYRQPRQSFQLAVQPPVIHTPPEIRAYLRHRTCPPRQPPPGDPAPSHFAPLPGILDVGDAGSRFGCPPRPPSAPPNPKSRKSPQTMSLVCLTLRNLSAILSPIR